MKSDRSGGGSWHEALEQRVLLDSAFAAVGYYNAPDPLNGGTQQVMYALEGNLDDATNTLAFRVFTSVNDTPVETTASVLLDATTGSFEVDLFGNGDAHTGALTGAAGSRVGWLIEPAEAGQPEEMSWWIERSETGASDLVRHTSQSDAFRGLWYRREDGSSDGRTHTTEAFFNVDTQQSNLSGYSGAYYTISQDGSFQTTAQPGKYQWSFAQTEPAWVYMSGDGTQYIAAQFGAANESSWVSVGLSRKNLSSVPRADEDYAGDYRVVRASEDVSGIAHSWANNGDEGVLTLAFDPATPGLAEGSYPARFVSDRTGQQYTGFWLRPGIGTAILVHLEPATGQAGLERYALSMFSGGFNAPILLGDSTLYQMTGGLPEAQPTRLIAVRIGGSNAATNPGGTDPDGNGGEPSNDPPPPPPPANADEFIEHFRGEHGEGLAIGNDITALLDGAVPIKTHERTPWGAENHWFQAGNGDVWSLWHGGAVHLLADGEHMWTLTNLADAAGLVGQMDFEPGSMSGVMTVWRAFSIQGIVDGQLVSLWWSPESAVREWGDNRNGWVLTPFTTDIVFEADTNQRVETLPTFKAFTDTQHNGRYAFDPRTRRTEIEFGMSVVLVDVENNVYAATFSTANNRLFDVPEGIANVWRLERLSDIPGVSYHRLMGEVNDLGFDYVVRASV